ncbi:Hypothetical protein GLP15_1885 [Giardia lamblia P15]|uniref:Uncharacterized protein n=1 Tax=Giardia intestinalis (strain P15) TaxID=658858 RepID=E1F5Y6_GIAIA|nr:Hypothetical protein GLP15_1885 [Giardia lamblia P15]
MFSANVRQFPLSSIFTPLNIDIGQKSEQLVYQRIAAACVLPKSNLLVILTFKFNWLKENQRRIIDQLLYVCTHDYMPQTCIRMLSKPELKEYQQHCSDFLVNMVSSPDERYLAIYTSKLILFYELTIIQSRSPSSYLRTCKFLAHISCEKCTTVSGNELLVDMLDTVVWSAIKPRVFVLAFNKSEHIVFTMTLKENQSANDAYSVLIHDDVHKLAPGLSALSMTNITSTDLDSCVCCIDTVNPLESKDGLINKIQNLLLIKASHPTTPQKERVIVCGEVVHEDGDRRTPHFATNFIKCFEVDSSDTTLIELYFFRLQYRNSIFEPVRSVFRFPTMHLSVSPRSVAFPFGIYSIDKQLAKQSSTLGSFKKNLPVCRLVARSCFNAYSDTSKLSEIPLAIYTGYPIVATAISCVSFMSPSANQLHHKFISDSSIDLEAFLGLKTVELVACADTRGYVHIYLVPLHQHRIFSAKLPLLAEKMAWTSTLDNIDDRTRSVFTLYVIGIADMVGQEAVSEEGKESTTHATRILKNVRTIYSIELPIVDIVRIFSVIRTTATIQHQTYEISDDSSQSKTDVHTYQTAELDTKQHSPEPEPERAMPLEYVTNNQDENEHVPSLHVLKTAHIKVSVKEEYSFYDFPSVEEPLSEELEVGAPDHADEDQLWTLLPEEEEIAELFGNRSDELINQTTNLLARPTISQNELTGSKSITNPHRAVIDTTIRDPNTLPVLPSIPSIPNALVTTSQNLITYPIETGLLNRVVLPQGEFTVVRLFPSDYFSPSLMSSTTCPDTANLLLDGSPMDYLILSKDVFMLVLSNGTAHLICHSATSTLSIIDTHLRIFNPHLLVPITCGKSDTILPVRAKEDNGLNFAIKEADSISSNDCHSFILLKSRTTFEYHILLFRVAGTKIVITLQSTLHLQYSPEYIYLSDSSIQLALSNGSLFILHIQSFLASGATESAQHLLHFTDVSGLVTPIFSILQTESVLLSKVLVQYTLGRIIAQGHILMSQLTSAPMTTPTDLSLHHAVLRSLLYKALDYGIFEFKTTGSSQLIRCLVSDLRGAYEEALIDVFVDISNSSADLVEELNKILYEN